MKENSTITVHSGGGHFKEGDTVLVNGELRRVVGVVQTTRIAVRTLSWYELVLYRVKQFFRFIFR